MIFTRKRTIISVFSVLFFLGFCSSCIEGAKAIAGEEKPPTLDEVLRAKTDLWGEAALRQENGASYEFFAGLLPPLRYVNAMFRHYPIVLSAPRHEMKGRFVSNGSGINDMAMLPGRWHEIGTPIHFRVGDELEIFGSDLSQLDGPYFAEGYLPVVQLKYKEYGCVYSQEAFMSTDPEFVEHGAVFVKFTLLEGQAGEVAGRVRYNGLFEFSHMNLFDGALRGPKKKEVVLLADDNWRWEGNWNMLQADLKPGQALYLVIYTDSPKEPPSMKINAATYEEHRAKTIKTWQDLLDKGMKVETPEAVVNDAWRTMLIGIYSLVRGNKMCYSSNNQYQGLYVAEGSDAVRGLMIWGHLKDSYEMMPPIIKSVRQGVMYHRAGIKLQMLNQYYWLARDVEGVLKLRDIWSPEIERIITKREPENGLLPRERYCGDIPTPVYNLHANANAWRGLRDTAAMLEEMGLKDEAQRAAKNAAEFRQKIIEAVKKSEFHNVEPPFIPVALFGEEQPYDMLPANRMGSYYDLVAPYAIVSGVFGIGAERQKWMIDYFQQHGGLCMGMVRNCGYARVIKSGVNDLYTRSYVIALLQNDDVEKALVSFYGKLAQGCTRNTFIGGEGSCLGQVDEYGREFSFPPNSAANAHFLWMLRYLLVQDWDMDDDGKPETLRLMYATPRRWLMDGKTIKVERAPTAFGEVSVVMQSRLKVGEIVAEVTAPPRPCPKMLLRARAPDGWKVTGAKLADKTLTVDKTGAVDISDSKGIIEVTFQVEKE